MFTEQLVDSAVQILFEYCDSIKNCYECKFLYHIDSGTTGCRLYSLFKYRKDEVNGNT